MCGPLADSLMHLLLTVVANLILITFISCALMIHRYFTFNFFRSQAVLVKLVLPQLGFH